MIVFLTGSAGLLGGAIAHQLAHSGHGVVAMVHRDAEIRGNDGELVPASQFDGKPPKPGQVRMIKGDVTRQDLGFDVVLLAQLQTSVDCVIHCAALVQFEAAFEDLRAVNVDGTRHLAESFPDARFVHISTAYTCGLQDGPIKEDLHSRNGPFANGYERSKALAEIELLKLRPNAIIARPSIVVGEHSTGRIRSFDTIYRAFKFIAEGRIQTVPTACSATLNFVPIDHVVASIIALATRPVQSPVIAHLAAREAVSAERFLKLIGEVPGLRSPHIASTEVGAAPPDGMAERLVRPYWSYFTRSPQFETDAIEQVTGGPSPEMDEAALLKQIDYCVEAGFIRKRDALVSDAIH